MAKRAASHAGSWYSSNRGQLDGQLQGWLNTAERTMAPARAIIAPHAGYSYSGPTAAWAYKQIDPTQIKRVFILGPSHHVSLNGCAVTGATYYSTPLYDLPVDQQINNELLATKKFEVMRQDVDEDEHSIEMHLPYIAKIMENNRDFTIIPILVGGINAGREQEYGRLFSQYLLDPQNLFVVSSDFCHWGSRFSYSTYDPSAGAIWESIERLDRAGMSLIEALNPGDFSSYLQSTRNTICGRHPIGVLLNAIDVLRTSNSTSMTLRFLHYAQSNQCKSQRDSSVSYASAALVLS